MDLIRLIYESFCRSVIRFFDNRFIRSDDIEYYRMEAEKFRQENFKLTKFILDSNSPSAKVVTSTSEEEPDWQPARKGYQSWESKRRELESASAERARSLANEAKIAMYASKSTEQLEHELLNGEQELN